MSGIPLVKAHAFGNDFLLADERDVPDGADLPALARAMCERHRGVGADGLILFKSEGSDRSPFDSLESTARSGQGGRRSAVSGQPFDSPDRPLAQDRRPASTRMRLLNADGSHSEVSGNGVRCLAAWLVSCGLADREVDIDTDAGVKRLTLLSHADGRAVFRAAMGQPEQIARVTLDVGGLAVDAITLRVGNPQCVVLGEVSEERLRAIAARLAVHPHFPEGTNVELAAVETPGRVKILIWERGVGPTEASGTGACAAAVAAITAGGAARDVEVVAPGGTQRVEWTQEGLFLTGWAEVIAEATWLR